MVIRFINKWAARILSIPFVVLAATVTLPAGFIWRVVLRGPFRRGDSYGQRFNRWMYDSVE